ncbi:MAG: tetratricopeptide repeat protein [Gemmatimonadota bacterium]
MLGRLRRFVMLRERGLTLSLGAALAVAVGILAVPPARAAVLRAAERAADAWEARWTRRLEAGERLVARGEYERAARYLAALDRRFPAVTVKHARDRERERLLAALGRSYTELGRKRLALDAFRRLVDFDPRNVANHAALARASLRFDEPEAARDEFAAILRVDPMHFEALTGYIGYFFDRGEYGRAVEAFRTYLDALVPTRILAGFGGTETAVYVPADGRVRPVSLALLAPGGRGRLSLGTDGFSVEIGSLEAIGPLLGGRPGRTDASAALPRVAWNAVGFRPVSDRRFLARDADPVLRGPEVRLPHGIERVELRIRVLKPVPPRLWESVRASYRNTLDFEGLADARARSALCPAAAGEDPPCSSVRWPGDL